MLFLPRRSARRTVDRSPLESMCTEVAAEREHLGLVLDISPSGIRLERPYDGPRDRFVQLEFEIPSVDEMVWAQGQICFDRLWRRDDNRLIRTSGIRIVSAATRHLRLLRDYLHDTKGQEDRRNPDWLMNASCYRT